jgi:hypothetical protein
MISDPTPSDRVVVRELLGREPRGRYRVAARNRSGAPSVLLNDPLLDDGTPMPTRYWLIDPDETRRIGRLESDGGVDAAEAAVDPDALADAHARYAAERDALIPADHVGPRPYGGVAGTRLGVKCLHAHWAWHLAGGDDPVAAWIAARLAADPANRRPPGLGIDVGDAVCQVTLATDGDAGVVGRSPVPTELRCGPVTLSQRWFDDRDPPHPAALTNALGAIDDELDELERAHPDVAVWAPVWLSGPAITALGRLEAGVDELAAETVLRRSDAEAVFRIVATEAAGLRSENPGLPGDQVGTIVATCCIVLAVMRRWHLDDVVLVHGQPSGAG